MPVASLWSLLLVAVSAAFALALKNAALQRTIKDIDKELDLLRVELDALKKQKNESESKLSGTDAKPENKKTGRAVDFTGVHLR